MTAVTDTSILTRGTTEASGDSKNTVERLKDISENVLSGVTSQPHRVSSIKLLLCGSEMSFRNDFLR